MNGQAKSLAQYLKSASKLVVPVYQRNYNWKAEHCQKLYSDLIKMIRENKPWHFFGGIVSVSDPMGNSFELLLIDGQQRVTTVSLLFLAMANLAREGKIKPEDGLLYDRITKTYLVDEINPKVKKMKLKPMKGDQDAYERLWGDPADYDRTSNLTQNYLFFYEQIQKNEVPVDRLFTAAEHLQIIDIALTLPYDDPQLVFESLNSTGLELSEGDKIRNYVLMGLSMEDQERYYDLYWNPIEKKAGYDSRTGSYDVSPFIRDYLGLKLRRTVSTRDVYPAFKDYAEKHGPMEALLRDLLDYAKRYQKLSGSPDFPQLLQSSLYRLSRFESSVTCPFFMEVFRVQEEHPDLLTLDGVAQVCRTVESYLLRRVICDLPSNALYKVFLSLCGDVKRLDGTYVQFVEKLRYILSNKREKAAFPTDSAFAEGLRHRNVYTMLSRHRAYLFERLENGDSAEYKEIYRRLDSGEYTIEHICPQKLTPAWSAELGDRAEEIHQEWLHRLANLTLTAYNAQYSNAPFSEKKSMPDGYLQSGLKLNQRIAQKDRWGLPELEERTQELTTLALKLWPYAATAYSAPKKQYGEAALDDGANLTGRILVKYRFHGSEHEAKSWAEMYAAVVRELHVRDRSYLNYLARTESSADLAKHFARTEDAFGAAEGIDQEIYLNTGLSTQRKISTLLKLFDHYGEDPGDLIFFLEDAPEPDSGDGSGALRQQYWQYALEEIQKATGTFHNVSPTKNNAVYGATKRPYVLIGCVANFDAARVELYIDYGDAEKNQTFFQGLKDHREEIEAAFGETLIWQEQEGVRSRKLYTERSGISVQDQEGWERLRAFHCEKRRSSGPQLPTCFKRIEWDPLGN